MKKIRNVLLRASLAATVLAAVTGATEERLVMPSGIAVRMIYRSLEPGEVVIMRLEEKDAAALVSFRFLEKDASFAGAAFGFLGLDLSQAPGVYPLALRVKWADGRSESLAREFAIGAKTFGTKSLKVPEEFVTPPTPEVEERVRREAELVAWVYDHGSAEWLGQENFMAPLAVAPFPNFGERRIYNGVPRSVHTGLDFTAPAGEPVAAANAGKVALASHLYFGGKTVILDHGRGVFTSYGHMSKLLVRRGDLVSKGTVVGLVGSTGRSTGPHLHWGVRVGGARVDPRSLLALPLD